MVADGSDTELCTYGQATQRLALLTGHSSKSYIRLHSTKSGVSRVLGLLSIQNSLPQAGCQACHVLTVTTNLLL
jgi:hypothetical protein